MRIATTQPVRRTITGRSKRDSRSLSAKKSVLRNPLRGTQWVTSICAIVFLLGYFPGILAGRKWKGELAQQLFAYYVDETNFSSWSRIFSAQMGACFLQLVLVWLCGFCVFGAVVLLLLFSAKGFFLGFCSSGVLIYGGGASFGRYWLTGCFPNIMFLFVALWLSGYAFALNRGLFQSTFLGGAPRGRLAGDARRLTIRFLLCVPLSCLISGLCSGMVLFVSRIL